MNPRRNIKPPYSSRSIDRLYTPETNGFAHRLYRELAILLKGPDDSITILFKIDQFYKRDKILLHPQQFMIYSSPKGDFQVFTIPDQGKSYIFRVSYYIKLPKLCGQTTITTPNILPKPETSRGTSIISTGPLKHLLNSLPELNQMIVGERKPFYHPHFFADNCIFRQHAMYLSSCIYVSV